MKKKWLKNKGNSRLIIFFNGWGMDSCVVNHLKIGDYDLIELNDYRVFDFTASLFKEYSIIYVVAWSLGVWVASYVLSNSSLSIQKSVAINGTCNPVDIKEGIDPDIFRATLKQWNQKNRESFNDRILGRSSKETLNQSVIFNRRAIQNQKEELSVIYNHLLKKTVCDFSFDYSLIGTRDLIFSCKNQLNYWHNRSFYKIIDMPHYPFLQFSCWDDILKSLK
ncbi:DUF452 family protein [Marinilabiliaceae bacterium ANBcel2]|nr:DUF452 family protein [Marinilabiliaceae bacterium ANBcel2]